MKCFNQVLLIITISILAASGLAKTASAVAATEHDSLVVAKADAKGGETKDDSRTSQHTTLHPSDGDGETKDDSRTSQHTTLHPSDGDGEAKDDTHASRGHGTNYQGVHHSESPNGDGDGETNDDG